MQPLLSAFKRLFYYNSLILLFPLVVSGQGLVPAGQEYCISGPLFGDQVRPQLVLSPNGGWLVWQDNSIDGAGFGVAAARLDAAGGPITNRFRVNQQLGGNQEKPRVTQLKNGNVLFAWEGMASVLANVYACFMTPSRVFLSAEIPMTTTFPMVTNQWTTNLWSWYSNRYVLRTFTMKRIRQESRLGNHDPAVAALEDGTAVLAYSGTRKYFSSATQITTEMTIQQGLPYANDVVKWVTSSGDDLEEVFFQRFAANGAKLGEETLVNQFGLFNQRHPAVTALKNGNFVVVWVSERHFPDASGAGTLVTNTLDRTDVQISGRLYNSSGLPLSDEDKFRINATNLMVCANPAVSAAADGSFLVTWSQSDTALPMNGWDIFGRCFSIDGRPYGPDFRVNSFTASDQSASQVSALGTDFLVAWTSRNQDGSLEGVFGQLVTEGVLVGSEFQINTSTRNKQIEPVVAALGANKFLAVWTHFAGMNSGFNLMAQRFDELTLPAPDPPSVTPWSQTSLRVDWPAVSSLRNYFLYLDQAAVPIILTNNSYEAAGFYPASTHSFRLAYGLTNGGCSRLSAPTNGTTWPLSSAAETATAVTNNTPEAGTLTGAGGPGQGTPLIRLVLSRSGSSLSLQWNTETGALYQAQMSTNLLRWSNVGAPQTGTGAITTQGFPAESEACFYRVIRAN